MTALEAKARGNAHFKKKEWVEAIKEFTTAIELEPTNHAFYSNRSAVHAANNDFENALKDGQKCVELKPEWAKGYGRVGFALFKLEKTDDAIKMYEEGLKHDENNASLKKGLEDCQSSKQSGDMSSAIWSKIMQDPELSQLANTDQSFCQKVNILCKNPQMAMQMGLMQDPQIALVFERAFGIKGGMGGPPPADGDDDTNNNSNSNPNPRSNYNSNNNPFDNDGKDEPSPFAPRTSPFGSRAKKEPTPEPEEELTEEEQKEREEQQLRETGAVNAKKLGNEFYANKEFEAAIGEYKKAQELNPQCSSYILNESAALFMLQQWDECIAACQRTVDVCRSTSGDLKWTFKAFQRMGSVEERRKNIPLAVKYYNLALIEQKDDKLRAKVKKIQQRKVKADAKAYVNPELAEALKLEGNALFLKGDFRGSIVKFEDASKRNPKDHKIYSNLAQAFCKVMCWEAAMDNCDKCLALEPTFVKAIIRKGKVLHALKQYHKALTCYEQAERLDANNSDLITAKGQTLMAIQKRNASGEVDEQARARALQDPEIQAAMNDPEVSSVLLQAQSGDPTILMKAMRDRPHIAEKIQKLVAAGVLRVG